MPQNSVFTFQGHTWDPSTRIATFSYKLEQGSETFSFTEVLTFPDESFAAALPQGLLTAVLDSLLLVLGISYYKLFCPKQLKLEQMELTNKQADFWNVLYTKGLGEFFYKNKIDYRGLISFPFEEKEAAFPVSFPRKDLSLIGIGGGKDSVVAGELLKRMQKSFTAYVVNSHPLMEQTIELLGVDTRSVKRQFDPLLFALNKRSDIYNGHVPVSAQLAFIGVFAAILYDYRYVVVANEESANYGSTEYLGEEINHQWSKSFAFEILFQDYLKTYITRDVTYFSLLRPWSELAITKHFIQYPQYFSVFSSCNRNFRLTSQTDKKWCGQCPKCSFAFSLLAAFLSKDAVIRIFGQNLFAKRELIQTYKELLGITGVKPFDCVGTPEEVRVAFYLVMQKKEYEADPALMMFQKEVLPQIQDIAILKRRVFTVSQNHSIPQAFQEVLKL